MDLAQEKRRLQELDAYGVKTTRQWNEWHREWERQHLVRSIVKRAFSVALFTVLSLLGWSPVLVPLWQLLRP